MVKQSYFNLAVNSTGYGAKIKLQGTDFVLNINDGSGYKVEIDFTADSSSQVLNFGNGSSSESVRAVLNGFTVQQESSVSVPAPSTLAIFALGMIGLASRRFKK